VQLADHQLSADEVRRLYDQHGPALVLYARSFVADGAAAGDVVHGVFLKLLRGKQIVSDVPAVYLYRAVRNAALNMRRDRSHDAALPEREIWFSHREHDREAALALQQALQELPDDQREVVVMRVWSGMTLEEVAGATNVPLNTAASRYRYALAKLRENLRPYEK
jgi:RNA polymerase sigma-70 factor (ECF subfamily)